MTDRTDESKLPRIYGVNWFRRADADGSFLWPGFGENSRVLEWICRRLEGEADAEDTPIGFVPRVEDLNLEGLDTPRDRVERALRVRPEQWHEELELVRDYFETFGDKLPTGLREELAELEERLS